MGKLIQFILTFLGITFLSFLLIYLAPSDPAEIMLSRTGVAFSQEQLEAERQARGLSDPLLIQYGRWLKNILGGDLGISMHSGLPVAGELAKAVPGTAFLSLFTLAVSFVISIFLGIGCAMAQGSLFDRSVLMLSNIFSAMPGYFISLLLLYFFSMKLEIFPVIADGAGLKEAAMPAAALAVGLIASYTRQIRALVSQEARKQYVMGARARGICVRRIYQVHILRNCITVFLTMAGVSLGLLLSGSIIVETIFGWPGLGRLAMEAITHRDYPMLQGYIVVVATAYFFINSLVDAAAPLLDPRQKSGEYAYG